MLGTVFERLSSGLRINSAKDDAAGLSVSTRMEAQIREHNQAIRNVNDGISMAQVAEGGMQEAMNTLQRMRELAVQSANGTYSSTDRANLETELTQLNSQLNSIASDTEFNGQKLLDGSFTGKKIQIGENESVSLDISQSVAITSSSGFVPTNGLIASYSFDGNANDGSGNGLNGTVNGATLTEDRFGNANSAYLFDGINDYIKVTHDNNLNFSDDFTVSTWVKRGGATGNSQWVIVKGRDMTNGYGLGSEGRTYRIGYGGWGDSDSVFSDFSENEWHMVTGVTDQQLNEIRLYVDGELKGQTPINPLTINNSHPLVIGRHFTTPTSDAGDPWPYPFKGEIDDISLHNKALSEGDIKDMYNGSNGVSVLTQSLSEDSIGIIDSSIDKVSDQQAEIGALQSRFESIQNNLMTAMENTSQARSRIMDADIAQETANLTTASILQQAGIAILAQANQQPQIALQLLG